MSDRRPVDLQRIAELSRLVRQAVRDKSYQACPIGLVVREYLAWKQGEQGRAKTTIRDYEIPLAYLCLDFPDMALASLEPPEGRKVLRGFIDAHWGTGAPAYGKARVAAGSRAPRTRNKNLSILSDFFKYAVREDYMRGDPTIGIDRARPKQARRNVYKDGEQQRIFEACPTDRERCAVAILIEYGLRKMELANIRLRDYDGSRAKGTLTITGKGKKTRYLPVVSPSLRSLLDTHWADRLTTGDLDEYLLYPQKWGPRKGEDAPPKALNWENRHTSLSDTAMHNWWKRCLARAGVPSSRQMHEMRHTTATDFLRSTRDLTALQEMLGHADISTTQVYLHMTQDDLAEALAMWADKRAAE